MPRCAPIGRVPRHERRLRRADCAGSKRRLPHRRRRSTPQSRFAVEGEESRPKTPPLGANLVLPGDDDLNYGTTIVSCALASFLMLTAALPSDWQAPPANTREARAVKVEALLRQNKKLAKKDGRVVEVQRASCPP